MAKPLGTWTVCQAFHNYGESHEDCYWGFNSKHAHEKYCDPCKPFVKKLQKKLAVQRFRGITTLAGLEALQTPWLASWIDRRCTACGRKGVPITNRFLCFHCFTSEEARAMANHDAPVHLAGINVPKSDPYHEEPGEVITFSASDLSQEQLQALVPSKGV